MKNHLNRAIKKMLVGKQDFDPQSIGNKIAKGSMINNSGDNTNTLSCVLRYTIPCIKNKKGTVAQILELIEILIDSGALPDNTQDDKICSVETRSGELNKIRPIHPN